MSYLLTTLSTLILETKFTILNEKSTVCKKLNLKCSNTEHIHKKAKFQAIIEVDQLRDYREESLKEELDSILKKSVNQRKIIDLMVIESNELKEDNKLMYEKYNRAQEVSHNLMSYSSELELRKKNLIDEIEYLKREGDTLRNAGSQIFNEEKEYEKNCRSYRENLFNQEKESIELKSKIEAISYELNKNTEFLRHEQSQVSSQFLKMNSAQQCLVQAREAFNYLNEKSQKLTEELCRLRQECDKSYIDYDIVYQKLEVLLKKTSQISKYNLELTELFEDALARLEKKTSQISKKNEYLELSSEIKSKVINSLREINSYKKMIESITASTVKPDQ